MNMRDQHQPLKREESLRLWGITALGLIILTGLGALIYFLVVSVP